MCKSYTLFPVLCAVTLLGACAGRSGSTGAAQDPQAKVQADMRAYRTLEAQLDGRRTQFLGKQAMSIEARSNTLYWLEYPGFSPTLHAYDDASHQRRDYGFSIGSGDDENFAGSASLVATALRSGEQVVFKAYAADQANQEVAELSVAAPKDGQKWWAYAVDGDAVYYVTTSSGTELFRWMPRTSPTAERLFSLEELGLTPGEFGALSITCDQALFIEGGRLWELGLSSRQATWLKNQTEIDGNVTYDTHGVLYVSASGPFYYDLATGQVTDVAALVKASPYKLNDTYSQSHFYVTDAYLHGQSVIYEGQSGVFQVSLSSGIVAPILLEPIDPPTRIDYRYPTVLDDGALFVVGLTSTDGAVGADGPVYRVDLGS